MKSVRHLATKAFWKTYHELPRALQRRADKQFALLNANPHHPSLLFKKIGPSRHGDVWSARVTQEYRALAVKGSTAYLWLWIGNHEAYERMLARFPDHDL